MSNQPKAIQIQIGSVESTFIDISGDSRRIREDRLYALLSDGTIVSHHEQDGEEYWRIIDPPLLGENVLRKDGSLTPKPLPPSSFDLDE